MRAIKSILVAAAALDLAFWVFYGNYLIHNRSEIPKNEFVMAFDAHGSTVYISKLDQVIYDGSFAGFFLLACVYAVFYFWDGTRER